MRCNYLFIVIYRNKLRINKIQSILHWGVIPKTELQYWTETTKHPLTIRSVISNDVGFCKIGMELVDLVGDQHEQSEFFNLDHEWPQINRCLNQRFGCDTVFLA